MRMLFLSLVLIHPLAAANLPVVANRWTRVQAVGQPGQVTGFDLLCEVRGVWRPVAEVRWCSGDRWSCRNVALADGQLRFTGFDTHGTAGSPHLTAESAVSVHLDADERFPEVGFRLAWDAFDATAWRAAWTNQAPLYFLRCTLAQPADAAQVFYQGGILYPGPGVDPYPITCEPMRGQWAPRWSYSVAFGADPTPAAGLWAPHSGQFAAYEFQGARSTDRSDRLIAAAYCAGLPDHPGQFMCLTYPHAGDWLNPRWPSTTGGVASRFRLLYHCQLPSHDDPNRFVLRELVRRYRPLLPPAPRMNDMSWLRRGRTADQLRFLHELGLAPDYPRRQVAPRLWYPYEECEKQYFEPGAVQFNAHQTGKHVRYAWEVGDTAGLERLKRELDYLVPLARQETMGQDTCWVWPQPLAGTFKNWWGADRATTTRHMFNWAVGSAMLSFYQHGQGDSYLPYLDGLVKWTRHYLYDRAGMADLPWAVFAMGAANGGEYLLDYADAFAADPRRAALAAEARALAEMVIFRNLYAYTSDPDDSDCFDPSFLLQSNNSHYWCGALTWGEMARIPEMAIQLYLETGEPYLAWLVRGCLERYHLGTLSEDGDYTENLGVFGEPMPRGGVSGGWGENDFRWLTEPLGSAVVQVDVGPQGALAFGRGTHAIDVTDYAWAPGPNVAFTLSVDRSLPGAPGARFDVQVTSPRHRLTGCTVQLDGQAVPGERYTIGAAGLHALIRGVQPGQRVQLGHGGNPAPVALPTLRPRQAFDPLPSVGFGAIDLRPWATAPVNHTWSGDWGGLVPGPRVAGHLPFCLLDPAQNAGHGAVPLAAGATLPVTGATPLVLVLGAVVPGDAPFPPVQVVVRHADGSRAVLRLTEANGLEVDRGSEWYDRAWRLMAFAVDPSGGRAEQLQLTGDALLFAISVPNGEAGQAALRLFTAKRQMARQQTQLTAAAAASCHWRVPVTTPRPSAPPPDPERPYRFLIRLDPVTPRNEAVVVLREALDALLGQIGAEGRPRADSLRAVRLAADGQSAGELPVQFCPDPDRSDRGDLLLKVPGDWYEPITVAVSFATGEAAPLRAARDLRYWLDGTTARFGSSEVGLTFELAPKGDGPRLTGVYYGGVNQLSRGGWDAGYGHLCACQDGVGWFDFGTHQQGAARADVVARGPLAMVVRISGLQVYGQLHAAGAQRGQPALKGQAAWYFRVIANDPRVDCWVDATIRDAATGWTRPPEARFAPRDASGGRTLPAAGTTAATCASLSLATVCSEPGQEAQCGFAARDGAVLSVVLPEVMAAGRSRSGTWRIMPGELADEQLRAESAAPLVQQWPLEYQRGDRLEPPSAGPWPLRRTDDWLARLPTGQARLVTIGQPDEPQGLRSQDNPDEGVSLRAQHAGRWHLAASRQPRDPQRYFYFALEAPQTVPTAGGPAYVAVEYYDRGRAVAVLDYDSVDQQVHMSEVPGAFKTAQNSIRCTDSRQWRTHVFALRDARFGKHCNGADFRLCVNVGRLWVSRVAVIY